MAVARVRNSLSVAVLAILVTASGCAGPLYWPWEKRDVVDPALYQKSASFRVEKVKKSCEGIANLPAAEQDRIAAEFGQSFAAESDPIVRLEMVRGLAKAKSQVAADVLKVALKDTHVAVRLAACDAWGKRGGPDAINALSESLQSDTNTDVRLAATRALGQRKDPAALSALAIALDERDPALQFRAMESMRVASGQNVGPDIEDWRQFAKRTLPQGNEALAERPTTPPK